MLRPTSTLIVLALWTTATGCKNAQQPSAPELAKHGEQSSNDFVAAHDVDAVDQPDSPRVVAHLAAGSHYLLQKRGGPGHNWCKVTVGADSGWLLCSQGSLGALPAHETGSAPTPPVRPPSSAAPTNLPTPTGDFAYYVLTLSWSPAFCETPAGARSSEQCGPGRHYAFVVHGLWPQNEHGWPEACGGTAGEPSSTLIDQMLPLMPSTSLIHHEWDKHGTCSGLSPDDYFATIRAAYASIHIPPAYVAPTTEQTTDLEHITNEFLAANPGLTRDELAVECKRELDEVRICLDKSLRPRACGSDVRSACKGSVSVPPLR